MDRTNTIRNDHFRKLIYFNFLNNFCSAQEWGRLESTAIHIETEPFFREFHFLNHRSSVKVIETFIISYFVFSRIE
ncbi:hypothetical protein CH375_23120 [Leptospira ellisii]|uniref:Uncharacterized protein n=1 Tax=Leptospira ellisii TaxID=2023197 RepID=A0A2N0BEN4_9LEPT|nr:hypothetical protein CH379_15485 [Leptospira ellisii]PKA02436.1 hypothetical protein CH375_23120 [Leptospira ellisii]